MVAAPEAARQRLALTRGLRTRPIDLFFRGPLLSIVGVTYFEREFGRSMGPSYLRRHGAAAVARHAGVSQRRAGRSVHVEVVEEPDNAAGTLCVVADDRPGLFALVSAALVMNDLDVLEGEAHTREVPGMRSEAVDLFVVRHADPARQSEPVGEADASAVSRTIRALLSGELTTRTAARPAHAEARGVDTTVRFLENDFGALATLEVETGDRSGLLLALADALYQQKVQIIASEVRTVGNRVLDRFQIVELDGQAISQARRLAIQLAVLSAVG